MYWKHRFRNLDIHITARVRDFLIFLVFLFCNSFCHRSGVVLYITMFNYVFLSLIYSFTTRHWLSQNTGSDLLTTRHWLLKYWLWLIYFLKFLQFVHILCSITCGRPLWFWKTHCKKTPNYGINSTNSRVACACWMKSRQNKPYCQHSISSRWRAHPSCWAGNSKSYVFLRPFLVGPIMGFKILFSVFWPNLASRGCLRFGLDFYCNGYQSAEV